MGEQAMFYTISEAAGLLGVSPLFIYRRVWNKELPAIRLSARRLAIPKEELESFLNARSTTCAKIKL